jgi:hypothetical protein
MSTTDRTVALVSWWVATYSRHLPAEVAERRRASSPPTCGNSAPTDAQWERRHRRWRSRSCGA